VLEAFADWLGVTPPSLLIQDQIWIVATTQSIHILAIAFIATSAVAIDLRLLGLTRRGAGLAALERRFLPWIWWSLIVLLVSGLILIIGEPARELLNWLFWVKMGLVAAVVALTAFVQARLKADPDAFEGDGASRLLARALGLVSLLLLAAIITAGRWIAYVL
jgi:magnesium-transporting ATPase (P-type)